MSLLAVAALVTSSGWAGIQQNISLLQVGETADVVAVGTLEDVALPGPSIPTKGLPLSFGSLHVEDILKGTLTDSTIGVVWTGEPRALQNHTRGIWRLSWDPSGQRYHIMMTEGTPARPIEELQITRERLAKSQPNVLPARPDFGFVWKADPAKFIVASVTPSSAAAEGHFEPGDALEKVEGIPLTRPPEFDAQMVHYAFGQRLKVGVAHDGLGVTRWLRVPQPSQHQAAGQIAEKLPEPFKSQYLTGQPLYRFEKALKFEIASDGLLRLFGIPFTGKMYVMIRSGHNGNETSDKIMEYVEGKPVGPPVLRHRSDQPFDRPQGETDETVRDMAGKYAREHGRDPAIARVVRKTPTTRYPKGYFEVTFQHPPKGSAPFVVVDAATGRVEEPKD